MVEPPKAYCGVCIGGPLDGKFLVAGGPLYSYNVQKDPPEAMMFDVGVYQFHFFNSGARTIRYWLQGNLDLFDAASLLIGAYRK